MIKSGKSFIEEDLMPSNQGVLPREEAEDPLEQLMVETMSPVFWIWVIFPRFLENLKWVLSFGMIERGYFSAM